MAVAWGVTLIVFVPRLLERFPSKKLVRSYSILGFIAFAFISSIDFVAATSWYWVVDGNIRLAAGLILYLVSMVWFKPFSD